ncbi:MAG: hypothetical protein C0475_04320 [Planctomyces sp.]|nr:hypothetical protein [Planctomyces sp.]MBA4039671.1 hypothetical protein [Planctomyces sp.]MBA4120417.1 hypothetical protein [Isosphaera sp.]
MPGTLPLRTYDLVIADIDGCLVGEAGEPFDLPALAQVREHNRLAIERGDRPIVTLCTGRPQPFAEAVSRLIGNTLIPCVCEMGVWLFDPAANRSTLDPAITPDHLAAVAGLSQWAQTQFGPGGVVQQPGKAASVSLWHPDTAYLRSLAPLIEQQCARQRWPFRVSMTWFYINCDLAHISKASGIARLLQRTNTPRQRLAGIGDTDSDRAIAQSVGFFACPSNAQPAIKELAHFIAKAPEAHGVVEILRHISH